MAAVASPRASRVARAVVLQAALVGGTVLAGEIALQVGSALSPQFHGLLMPPWERHAPTLPDARLRFRGNPYNPEHDRAGYRNPTRPQRADVVVLGDSHSYGPARAADGWVPLLGQRLGLNVYNMALPGYGPGQSLLQIDEALALQPRLVVVAPYFGNDFFDTYELAKGHPQLLKSIDPALIAAAEAAERRQPLEAEILTLYALGEANPPKAGGLRGWLSDHVKLYGLLRAVAHRARSSDGPSGILAADFERAVASLSPAQRRHAQPLDGGDWRTILTPAYRGRALDDADARIRVGFEATRAALLEIGARCRAAGVPLLVVLMPTKETVFWPRVSDPSKYPGLGEVVGHEARLRGELTRALSALNVPVLDPLDTLRKATAQPYFPNVDGHPNEVGHAIVADAVAQDARAHLK